MKSTEDVFSFGINDAGNVVVWIGALKHRSVEVTPARARELAGGLMKWANTADGSVAVSPKKAIATRLLEAVFGE